ncbi:MAG: acyl-CoA/acyl-ACP dehydrogenase, partial [Rhodospirillaceae bacterium]|nr:acyl-CoA/acyl-ACP dehydrogenase [Rhodospirillaceae bacterium]
MTIAETAPPAADPAVSVAANPYAPDPEIEAIRQSVRALCAGYPGEYWREKDRERAYPTEFVRALTEAGFLAVLVPEEYGGSGLGLRAACAILEEIHKSGGNGAACHAQMYIMGTILRHGSEAQKTRWLPGIASGDLRLQAFGVTEPGSGTDTLSLRTVAEKKGNDRYVVNGQKVWTSRAEHSDLMLLLARTTPKEEVKKRTEGLSVFVVDMREARGNGLTIRPIGQNQGIQFPIAKAYAATEAADLMVQKAASLFDAGEKPGAEANMAKMLAADAAWEAADMCMQAHGGFAFAEEYDIERKFRETRLYRTAPISTNLIL